MLCELGNMLASCFSVGGKNHVIHHLFLTHHQCSNHLLLMAMVRQETLNWRHDTFTQNANAIEKCKLIFHIMVQGILLLKPSSNVALTMFILSNGKKLAPWLRNSWKKKRGQRSPPMVALFCPYPAQSQVSCCIFLNYMSRAC